MVKISRSNGFWHVSYGGRCGYGSTLLIKALTLPIQARINRLGHDLLTSPVYGRLSHRLFSHPGFFKGECGCSACRGEKAKSMPSYRLMNQ